MTFDIDVDGSTMATFTHDLRGLLATRTLENGASSTYTYDAAARLQAMRGTVPVTYSLNAVGQRTGRHDAAFGPESYAYDAIDQVIGANYGGVRSEGFAYDAMGNRQSASDTAAGITAYTVRADNTYTSVGGISTETDLNGNMVASPLKTENGTLTTGIYAYDAQNRLTSATVNGVTTELTYDSRNRVVRRTSGSGTLNLTYSGWNLIEERNGGGELDQVYVHGAGIDEILVKITATGPAYYHHDGLGSTIALTGENGELLESYRYDAFGAVSVFNSSFILQTSSLVSNRFLFTGRDHRRLGSLGGDCRRQPVGRDEQERASQLLLQVGLYDYRNRVYSAELGRFLQTDPIRFSAGDGNLYRYVGNNPVNAVDPTGLYPGHSLRKAWDLFQKVKAGVIDDKYAHCVAHCEISRDLGPEVSDAIGKGKELADWCKKQLGGGGGGWDRKDEKANKDGRSAAKETQKSCEMACGERGYSP